MDIKSINLPTTKLSPDERAAKKLRGRLDMMARNRNPLQGARDIARKSIELEEKVSGENGPNAAYRSGKRVKNFLVRFLGIATDKTGKVAEEVISEIEENSAEVVKRQEEKRKELEKKFAGSPHPLELVLDGIGQLDNPEQCPPVTRRTLLFSGPKKIAAEAATEIAPMLLPWPFNRIAALFKYLRTQNRFT